MAFIVPFLPAIAEAVSVVGTVVSVAGAISNAKAQSDSYNSEKEAMQSNALVANQNAHNALQVADANEEAQRRKNRLLLGDKRASLIQSGIGTEGSALDIIGQSASNAELDALNIRYEGSMRARSYQQQASNDLRSADQAGNNADAAVTSGMFAAGGAALSGVSGYYKNQDDQAARDAQIKYYKTGGSVNG